MEDIRKQFPILNDLVYFDSAALVLKPQVAIDAIIEFYSKNSISSRTIDTPIGYLVNEKITSVRQKVANLVGAKLNEVMYTSGTTESINLFSKMFARLLNKGDVILVSAYNHSSNLIPWVEIAKEKNAIVKVSNNILNDINSIKNLRLVALGRETNNYAIKYDLEKIYEIVKQKGAFLLNDAAQAIIHQPVKLKELWCNCI
ncbi:aminotransferase class V-fold PLP-dependent enzyme [Mycoplasmopsis cynos]|uniref:aminotransferase class V-fold PLP-dependent enzyme n=1 Tax=Mycoplasmopsis cynos TaxID=171284 RepID=UPI0024CBBD7B|nr:aminotransferase class V-fold PLP-dependent enzyme [Mycoplasmopsis cynos]WAM06932.1 aminotransferase class V-fold PLP-dependent enzyme [Mycoplasmopsis cynos]